MNIQFDRAHACRLYGALGQILWLHSATNGSQSTKDKLLALENFTRNIESEIGIKRINQMQDDIYHELANT